MAVVFQHERGQKYVLLLNAETVLGADQPASERMRNSHTYSHMNYKSEVVPEPMMLKCNKK